MSFLEWVAAGLLLINIILVARRSVWNFPFAIAGVALYVMIFWQARLYSMAGLQVFFVIINAYGWWAWWRGKENDGDVIVRFLSPAARVVWIIASFSAVIGWGWTMQQFSGGAFPYSDAAGAMLSVVAQILMVWRYVENWAWWVIVNIISVVLFVESGLYVSSALYMLNWGLAVYGLVVWSAEAKRRLEGEA
jgi:nicotinamide mononucleotide transporter